MEWLVLIVFWVFWAIWVCCCNIGSWWVVFDWECLSVFEVGGWLGFWFLLRMVGWWVRLGCWGVALPGFPLGGLPVCFGALPGCFNFLWGWYNIDCWLGVD